MWLRVCPGATTTATTTDVSVVDWLCVIAVLVWLSGVGLMAHAVVPLILKDENTPDLVRLGMREMPELLALPLAIAITGWPLAMPVLIALSKRKKEK